MGINILKQLPSVRVPLVDKESGKINPTWFRFLDNLTRSGFMLSNNNLSDVVSPSLALANLGGLSDTGSTALVTVGTITIGMWNASIISPTYGGTGVNNGLNTLTLGGNLRTSGVSVLTLTTTGTTNATIPSGTVTLVPTSTDISSTGIVTKTNNVAFAASATTDTTNASNIASGTLNIARLPSTTGSGNIVLASSPSLTTPDLGTPSNGNLVNCTFPVLNQNTSGNAATVTTNANLTGNVTSVGNATTLVTGVTASKFTVGVGALPSFSVYNSTSTTLTASTFVKVTFGTTEFDTSSAFDTTNSRYVPTVPGIYRFNSSVFTTSAGVAANTAYYIVLVKNGSQIKYGSCSVQLANNVSGVVDAYVTMNGTTDYIEVFFYNGNATTSMNTNNSSLVTYFEGSWIGPAT